MEGGAILSFFCTVHMKVKKTCSCFTLGNRRVASYPLASVLHFPFTFHFQQQDIDKNPNQTKKKKTVKESWKGNLSMALTSMHCAPGGIKLIPKSCSPEDRWVYTWVLVSANSVSEFRHIHNSVTARACIGRAIVAVQVGCCSKRL